MQYTFELRVYGDSKIISKGNFALTEEQEKLTNFYKNPELLIETLNKRTDVFDNIVDEIAPIHSVAGSDSVYDDDRNFHLLIYKKGEDGSRFVVGGVVRIEEGRFTLSPHNAVVFGNKFGQAD